MPLTFTQGGSKKRVMYAIKPRTMQGENRKGFTNADVLYMLMPDRFANGNPKNDVVKGMRDELCNRNEPSLRHGGDIEGIRQHLDYFKELGVTALWFTPLLETTALPTRESTVRITAMPLLTTIVLTHASEPTTITRHW